MLGHPPTFFFFWPSICLSLLAHGWCGFWNALFPSPGSGGRGWLAGFFLPSGKRIFTIALVSDTWITPVVCMLVGICYVPSSLVCVEVWGSQLYRMYTPLVLRAIPQSQSALLRSESSVAPRQFASEATVEKTRRCHHHSLASWDSASCCG